MYFSACSHAEANQLYAELLILHANYVWVCFRYSVCAQYALRLLESSSLCSSRSLMKLTHTRLVSIYMYVLPGYQLSTIQGENYDRSPSTCVHKFVRKIFYKWSEIDRWPALISHTGHVHVGCAYSTDWALGIHPLLRLLIESCCHETCTPLAFASHVAATPSFFIA